MRVQTCVLVLQPNDSASLITNAKHECHYCNQTTLIESLNINTIIATKYTDSELKH